MNLKKPLENNHLWTVMMIRMKMTFITINTYIDAQIYLADYS